MVGKRYIRFTDEDGNLLCEKLHKIAGNEIIALVMIIETLEKDVKEILLRIAGSPSYDYIKTIIEWGADMKEEPIIQELLEKANDPVTLETIKMACVSFALETKEVSNAPNCLSVRGFLENIGITKKEALLSDFFYSIRCKALDDTTIMGIMRNDFTWDSIIGQRAWACLLSKEAFDGIIEFCVADEEDTIRIKLSCPNEYGHVQIWPKVGMNTVSEDTVKSFINSKRKEA